MNALLPLLLFTCQDPAPAPAPVASQGPHTIDVVELKNGDVLEGHITNEIDGYVEIELDAGATVGVSRAQVAAVRHGAKEQVTVAAAMPPDNAWFVLHDARGASVGWLHSSLTTAADGGFTISEEYEFVQEHRRYQVTSLCTADARGTAVSCYFRERIGDPLVATIQGVGGSSVLQAERALEERIVEATCRDDHLQVTRLDGSGRHERELPWSAGATFPLLARTLARHQQTLVGPETMFDPSTEELVQYTCDATRSRHVVLDGEPHDVAEVAETTAVGHNSEWVDAKSHRTLRRELAGPALVAVPSNAESARNAVGLNSIQSAILAEPGGTFGMWIPNPAWAPVEGLPAGQISLQSEGAAASIGLTVLGHLDAAASLDTAADAVANWFRLLYPELRLDARVPSRLRDRVAVQLQASGKSAGTAARATVDIVPHQGHFLVLICRAPSAVWDEVAPDFDFVRRSIEFDAQSLAPTLQGPLVHPAPERSGRRMGPIVVPNVSEVRRDKPAPIVRIPD